MRPTGRTPAWPRSPRSTPSLPRHTAVAAYLHEKAGDTGLAADLYVESARAATNAAERDHLTRQAARLRRG